MPDFGIFRGFNDKLFGDKLYAGQLPTQLGIIGSEEVFNTDSDAQAFFDRVTAAGGTLSATEKTAIDTLVKQMKLDGIWSKMKAIYPMVGASAAACAQNLKSSSFTGTFTSGWTFASTGVTPNGTSAYFNTQFIESINSTLNSGHLSFYSRTQKVGNIDYADIGVIQIGVGYSVIFTEAQGSQSGFACQSIIATNVVSNINTLGLFIASRQSSTSLNVFIRNNKTVFVQNSLGLTTIPIYVGARNFNNTINAPSTKECAFASIGDGLNDTEASNFYTAVQAFQTTLSRNV
jgi:hypothetical protein